MNSNEQNFSPAASAQRSTNCQLIVIAPPLSQPDKLIKQLFHDVTPAAPAAKTTLNPFENSERFTDPLSGLTITGLLAQKSPEFNHGILASQADAILLIIDGSLKGPRNDFKIETLAQLAAIPQIIVAIDNMSALKYEKKHFEAICNQFTDHLTNKNGRKISYIPIDLHEQKNLHDSTDDLQWYDGEPLVTYLSNLTKTKTQKSSLDQPSKTSDQFAIFLSWFSDRPLLPRRHYLFDNGRSETQASISNLKYRLNLQTTSHHAANRLFSGDVGYANMTLEAQIAFELFEDNRDAGSFYLKDLLNGEIIAFGIIKHSLYRASNIQWQPVEIDKATRSKNNQQTPCVLWFTGLSGSGKSSVASLVEKKLHELGKHTYLLDGDNIRHGLCRDLGFTDADRVENQRRIAETASLFVDAGLIVLASFISPFRSERQAARELFEDGEFLEIYMDAPLDICEKRDPKGLYKKARAGQLKNFTGLDSAYEPPETMEIRLQSATTTPDDLANKVIAEMAKRNLL